MPRSRRSAVKKVQNNTSVADENVAALAVATLPPKRNKRTLDSIEPNELTPATTLNPPSIKTRSPSSFQSAHSPPPPHGHSAFHSTHHTLPHAYAAFDVDTNNSEGSEELEDDWLEDTQDAQPVARASKMSATVIHERPMWHGQAVIPKTTTLALSPGPGNETEIDDGPLVGNCGSAHSNSTLATASRSHRTWPAEIDLVCVDSGKLKLSVQSQLLKLIIKEAFENLRQELLFDGAFPTPKDIPRVVRKCLVNAARDHSTRGGHNASAACVHHRLLTDIDYEIKMGQLPRRRISNFRGQIKEYCAQMIQPSFDSIKDDIVIVQQVVKYQLGENYNYIFPLAMMPSINAVPLSRLTRPIFLI